MDEKRERILKVAQSVFARFGIAKTTMDEIAKLARMGKSTLYYYFKSKEDIFAEVIRKESITLRHELMKAIGQAKNPKEQIYNYVHTRMKFLKQLTIFYSTLTSEYLEHYSFVEKERKSFTDFEEQTIQGILNEGVEKGIFDIDDTCIAARMITIAMKGLEFPLIIDNEGENLDGEIDFMLNILFKGIEKR